MHHREVTQSRQAYIPWLQELQDFGDDVEVRGLHTKEFLNCVTVVKEPWHHCILIPSRRWNPWLALSEALWILAGRDDIKALLPYNSHIGDYSDDGVRLYGAYGARIYDQIDDLVGRLRKDPNDRRAVLQIWDDAGFHTDNYPVPQKPRLGDWHNDLTMESRDPPCNTQIMFKLRQGKLHMTVTNRSNDLHFGLMAVNLPTFGILQSYIAARLGVDMGTQTHFSNSLHIYTDEPRAKAITDRMLYQETEDMPKYPEHDLAFENLMRFQHQGFASACSAVLEDVPLGSGANEVFPFLAFAREFLKLYRDKPWKNSEDYAWQETLRPWKYQFTDWIVAGQMFIGSMLTSGDNLIRK